jgi:hypothetical protein
MLASASAAALATLAITVAVPAIADNAGGAKSGDESPSCLHGPCGPKKVTGMVVIEQRGPSEQELRSCLTTHGVTLPAGDGRVLKNWLLEHGDDAANRGAMKACHFAPPSKVIADGPCASKAREVRPAVRPGKPQTTD